MKKTKQHLAADTKAAAISTTTGTATKPQGSLSDRPLLRYPGGKTRAVAYITGLFPDKLDAMLSPFLGGGSIELAVAARGTTVYGYDAFLPLVEFWQCLVSEPEALAAAVSAFFPLQKSSFYQLQQTQAELGTKLERAAAYYVLNRSSFSGSTLSGGMSPEHPRFTETSIERLRSFYNPNIHIAHADFKTSLAAHPGMFTYLDPPYWIKNSLYGKKGNAHRDFDHTGLAEILCRRDYWILSYNDCPEVRELYRGHRMEVPSWKYGMSTDKASRELLIFSKDLHH